MLTVTPRLFRALVVLSFLLPVGGTLLDLTLLPALPIPRSGLLVEESSLLFAGLGVLNWIVAILSTIGLWLFRPWSRPLSLLGVALGVVLYLFSTYFVSSGITTAVTWVGSLIGGGVLALAYYSPIAASFAPNNSFKPAPLRDVGKVP